MAQQVQFDLSGIPPQSAAPPAPAPSGFDLSGIKPDDRTWIGKAADVVVPTALRIGPSIVGSVVGSLGGPAGTVAGGGAGGLVGEGLAEGYEVLRGLRTRINPTQLAVQTGLGFMPVFGKAGKVLPTVLSRAGQGAAMGLASSYLTPKAEGQEPTAAGLLTGTAAGALLGAGGGALEAKFRRAPSASPRPAPAVVVPVASPGNEIVTRVDGRIIPPGEAIPPQSTLSRITERRPDVGVPPSKGAGLLPPDAPRGSSMNPDGTVSPPTTPLADAELHAKVSGAQVPPAGTYKPDEVVKDWMVNHVPEHQRGDMLNLLKDHGDELSAQRRDGPQSWERARALAAHMVVDPTQVKPGTTMNDVQTIAYASHIAKINDDISALSAKVKAGTAGPDDQLRLVQLIKQQMALILTKEGAATEGGRALNANKVIGEARLAGSADLLHKLIKENRDIVALPEFAEKWATLTDDVQRMDYIKSLQRTTWGEAAQAVWYANMLSNPATFARNFIGSTSNIAFNALSHVAATGYDVARHVTTGAPRTMYLSELGPQTLGGIVGVKQGLDDAWLVLRHGYSRNAMSAFDMPRKELRWNGANPFNWPGRILEASDQLMHGIVLNSQLYGRMMAKARSMHAQAGLKGEALSKAVAKSVAEWKLNPPQDVIEAARAYTARSLFREEGGKNVKAILHSKEQGGPMLRLLLNAVTPFVKVPANIIRQGIENFPGGSIATEQGRAALNAGGRSQAEAMGRMATAGVALGTLAYWAHLGKVSGAGPKDPEERAALMEAGWMPNSIKIGEKWVPFSLLVQAVSVPLFAVSNYYEKIKNNEIKNEDIPGKAAEILLGTVGSVSDQSFFQGFSDLIEAMNNPSRYAAQYAGRLTQNLVPFAGLTRGVAQSIDPVVRKPDTVAGVVQSALPGASKGVNPRLTRFGEEVTRPGPVPGLNPIRISAESKDPVVRELGRLGISSIGLPPKELEATKLTPAYTLTVEEQQAMGRSVKAALEVLFKRPGWQTLDPARAKELVDDTVKRARSMGILKIRRDRAKGR